MTPMACKKSATGSTLSVLVLTFLKTSPACFPGGAAWLACAWARPLSAPPTRQTTNTTAPARINRLDQSFIGYLPLACVSDYPTNVCTRNASWAGVNRSDHLKPWSTAENFRHTPPWMRERLPAGRKIRRQGGPAAPSYLVGAPSSVDPANTLRPSARLIDRAFPRFEPSLARYPSTVMPSPGFREFRVQPLRISPLGLPNS